MTHMDDTPEAYPVGARYARVSLGSERSNGMLVAPNTQRPPGIRVPLVHAQIIVRRRARTLTGGGLPMCFIWPGVVEPAP
jgi:hypothetical protein